MPFAILLCGPSLAGKSTTADSLRSALNATVISADEINAQRGLPFGGEGLPEAVWAETLRIQIAQLHDCGQNRRNAIIDDTLCYRWLRDRFRAEAALAGLTPILLQFNVSHEQIWERWEKLIKSNDRPILSRDRLSQHLSAFEWPAEDEVTIEICQDLDVHQFIKTHLPGPANAA